MILIMSLPHAKPPVNSHRAPVDSKHLAQVCPCAFRYRPMLMAPLILLHPLLPFVMFILLPRLAPTSQPLCLLVLLPRTFPPAHQRHDHCKTRRCPSHSGFSLYIFSSELALGPTYGTPSPQCLALCGYSVDTQ